MKTTVLDLTPHIQAIINQAAELVAERIARDGLMTKAAGMAYLDASRESFEGMVKNHGIATIYIDNRPRFRKRDLDAAIEKDSVGGKGK